MALLHRLGVSKAIRCRIDLLHTTRNSNASGHPPHIAGFKRAIGLLGHVETCLYGPIGPPHHGLPDVGGVLPAERSDVEGGPVGGV